LCWNPIAALTQATLGQITSVPVLLATAERMMVEADAMAAALGLTIAVPIAQRIRIAREATLHKMSMLQDLELGRPLEFDVIRDSFQDIQELSGVATPALDLVLSLMDLRSRTLESARAAATSG
jgi:2-dehydropantoate 2-reductase